MTTSILESLRSLGAPILVIVLGMVVLLMDLGESTPQRRKNLPIISIIGLVLAAIVCVPMLGFNPLPAGVEPATLYFGHGMVTDRFGGMLCIVLCLVAALAVLMSGKYLEEKGINQGEFYALLLFSAAGGMLMALSYDLVNVFVGLEVLSVALYILSGFARRELRSEEAAVKYFLLGSFASCFLLFGTALVYGAVGLTVQGLDIELSGYSSYTNFYVISRALAVSGATVAPLVTSPMFVAGIALVIVGLGFKAAIVPFHSYAPDVYQGAPTPVTAFMSVGAKVGAFGVFLRLMEILVNAGEINPFRYVLWGLAAATMLVGNILAVRQTSIKRMLACSSIAHAGYILVGVLASATPGVTQIAKDAIVFYLFAYTFMNVGAFGLVVWLGHSGGEYGDIQDYHGLGKRRPAAAAAMAVFMLSLAGIPPTAGFLGKLYLFLSALQAQRNDLTALAVLGLVVSAIGVYYYLGIVVAMYFREPRESFAYVRGGGAQVATLIAAVATILFGLIPIPGLVPSPTRGADVEDGAPIRRRSTPPVTDTHAAP